MHPSIHAVANGDKPAFITAETGEVVTYRQLDRRSNQGAHLFREAGLQTGDMVALFLTNGPRFLETVWAAQRSGLYYVCMPVRLTASELRYMIEDAGAKALVFSAGLADTVREAVDGLGDLALFATDGEAGFARSFERLRDAMPDTPIADEAPGQDMLYSSGTTGHPKGIKRPRPAGGIDEPTPVTNLARTLYGMDADSIYLCPAPLYHSAPLRYSMSVNQLGGTVIVMTKFDPEEALRLIERHRVTHAQWVPTHFVRMLKLPEAVRERYDHSSLRSTFHAAAPCPVEIKQAMIDWWGPIVHEYYSSTELNGFTAATAEEWLAHKGTVGRAIIGEIRICDENDDPLPPRREGMVYFEKGNPIEYHNDPEKTAAAYNRHGWTSVGDIGWVDEEGYLYLTDRQSFMIISGGVNIYPQEIENLLVTHPRVADAAVIGAPDPDLGERVVAVIQPLDWSDAGDALATELDAFLRKGLSPVKMPKRIEFMRELPRQPTGKLFKRLIRDRFREAAAAPAA
ncbi:acyl-CoA synthetase [Sphingomonas sp. YL-JM2C]